MLLHLWHQQYQALPGPSHLATAPCHSPDNAGLLQGVIPAKPDAWVWLGDMAYLDIPPMDCSQPENADHPDCNCETTFLLHPPNGCKTGDVQNAQRKLQSVLRSDGYLEFLEFMCPGAQPLPLSSHFRPLSTCKATMTAAASHRRSFVTASGCWRVHGGVCSRQS